MKTRPKLWAPVLTIATGAFVAAAGAAAQQMVDIGFESVGRGRPLRANVHELKEVGPAWRGAAFLPVRPTPDQTLDGFRPDELQADIEPLPKDVFTSSDFYADKALWSDPRYFRCNSPAATEMQRGIVFPNPLILTNETADGVWGHCDVDYPREAIVSPYGFGSAEAHYEALRAEAKQRGTLKTYTYKDFPAVDWNGVYPRPIFAADAQKNWYWLAHSQVPTVLSLLTPEYQQRMVQEIYHQVRGHALWPSTFCWPEGFMRRWYMFSVWEHYIIATPNLVQISAAGSDNFTTNVYVGREFNKEDVAKGGVPRLGQAVPRWFGETIGFWDDDTLVTWTSSIQAWKAHSAFEFSNQMQTIEIYTPIRDDAGKFVGLNHEAVFYDPEALVEPIRIARNLHKMNEFTDPNEEPQPLINCVQTIFPIDGITTPVAPGTVLEYEVPDMYGRPWDAMWRKYFEQGMTGPAPEEDLFDFSNR